MKKRLLINYNIIDVLKLRKLEELKEYYEFIEQERAKLVCKSTNSTKNCTDLSFSDKTQIKVYNSHLYSIKKRIKDVQRSNKTNTQQYNERKLTAIMTVIKAAATVMAEQQAKKILTPKAPPLSEIGYDPMQDPMIKDNRAIQLTVVEGKTAEEARIIISREKEQEEAERSKDLLDSLSKEGI